MQLSQLILQLQTLEREFGDLPVLKEDGSNDSIYELTQVSFECAEEAEYPPDWDMPEGFEFILLRG